MTTISQKGLILKIISIRHIKFWEQDGNPRRKWEGTRKSLDSVLISPQLGICNLCAVVKWCSSCLAKTTYHCIIKSSVRSKKSNSSLPPHPFINFGQKVGIRHAYETNVNVHYIFLETFSLLYTRIHQWQMISKLYLSIVSRYGQCLLWYSLRSGKNK